MQAQIPVAKSLRVLAIAIAPIAIGASHSLAQTSTPTQSPSEPSSDPAVATVCAYDASSGVPDPLGSQASLTIRETDGDTTFIYERLPASVGRNDVRAEVDNERTLTLYQTPVTEARQLLVDDAAYYAVLLGLAVDDPFIARGFAAINDSLACQTDNL